MKRVEIKLWLVVTDVGAVVASGDEEDRGEVGRLVSEAIRFEGAKVAEVRQVSFDVELLGPPVPEQVSPKPAIVVEQDIRELVEAEMKIRYMQDRDQAWDAIMSALPSGLYRITKDKYSRSMSREEEK
jgi:hypothetical protein